MLFVAWDDGSGVGMILNGCEEFCETSIELDVSYLYSVLGDRMDLLSVKNQSFWGRGLLFYYSPEVFIWILCNV